MRTPRKKNESEIYHVVARGTGRQIIFEDDKDREHFLVILKKLLAASPVELYAWCLMSNHVHLLVHAPDDSLSDLMRKLLGSYALYFNAKTGRVGHLFQERFMSEPVDDDPYLLVVIRYIHQNPVKANLSDLASWRWSSYHEYLDKPRLCTTEFPLSVFGSREEFEHFHEYLPDEKCLDVPMLRSATRGMPDEAALAIARQELDPLDPNEVKALDRAGRDRCLMLLKHAGLTIKQIERLTGIGRSIIQRVR